MPRQVTSTVYKYEELSDRAKERARDWYRSLMESDDYSEYVITDFATIAGFCGWDIKQTPVKLMNGSTRYDPTVYWSGFSSQGNGACFEGQWRASRVNTRALYKHAPKDTELRRIGHAFATLKKAAPRGWASVKHRGHGQHEMCTEFEISDMGGERVREELREDREEKLKEASRDLMRWVYRQLEKEYEYQTSDEQVAETIEANEYEFTEDGTRA